GVEGGIAPRKAGPGRQRGVGKEFRVLFEPAHKRFPRWGEGRGGCRPKSLAQAIGLGGPAVQLPLATRALLEVPSQRGVGVGIQAIGQPVLELGHRRAGLPHEMSSSRAAMASCKSFWTRLLALKTAATLIWSCRAASAPDKSSTAVRRKA